MPTDQTPKQLIAQRLKDASNILVTVSHNPSVDELSAALALTLMLEKLDKAATAVFSGQIPPAIEFLQPGKTFDVNVDGLRDFIIALDKTKADRLRYKVEDDVVRVFITPYKTTITEKDLSFSQGDFNVDLIVAFGVEKKEDLDAAITAHGRILHDAGVVTINQFTGGSSLGEIDWSDPSASSLCEMLMSLSEALQSGLLDQQITTAILTGLVAATDRFRNDKTSPKVMTMAAQLMAAGANQQLIAEKLESDPKSAIVNTAAAAPAEPVDEVGTIRVAHDEPATQSDAVEAKAEAVAQEESRDAVKEAQAELAKVDGEPDVSPARATTTWRDIQPPMTGGTLNATSAQAEEDERTIEEDDKNRILLSHDLPSPSTGILTAPVLNATSLQDAEPTVEDIFATEPPKTDTAVAPAVTLPVPPAEPIAVPTPTPVPTADPSLITGASGLSFEETPVATSSSAAEQTNQTLADLEEEVHRMAEVTPSDNAPLADARAAVDAALGAQPLGDAQRAESIAPTPVQTPPSVPGLPPLPPLPPMPDFSTLPPLPGEGTASATPPAAPIPTFGLPAEGDAAPSGTPTVAPSGDPGQFRLPGQ